MAGTLTYRQGDLLLEENPEGVIAHGVNCRGAFGAGIAGQIANQYPKVKSEYLKKYNRSGWYLGQTQLIFINRKRTIINMATQENYGSKGVFVSYDAVKECLDTVLFFCEDFKKSLAIPKVGSGLAGGDWSKIEKILLRLLMKYSVDVTVYSL